MAVDRGAHPSVAPRHFIYLGDAVSLVFGLRAMRNLGGKPVLLDVEVARSSLEPDPAYLEAVRRLASLGLSGYGTDASSSLRWSGRVATRGPVSVRQRRVCDDLPSLAVNLARAQLPEHAQAWHDDRLWQSAAAAFGASVQSGSEWRARVGQRLTSELFRPY
jgi:hypothetical protein